MDLMKIGTQLLMNKLSGGASGNSDLISSVLGNVLSGGSSEGGMGGIISALQENGLGDIADSWLGDGDNQPISSDQLRDVLGGDKVTEMASELDTDEGSFLDSLTEAIPQMVDNGSSGGSLLDSVGGVDGAIGIAKKLFG